MKTPTTTSPGRQDTYSAYRLTSPRTLQRLQVKLPTKSELKPGQALSASLSGVGAESSVKEWTVEHCELES